ncbi:MAG: FAD-binding oxidoreductase [Alphaproteobacteria bacterium]|nr:FAD-binding oxidoreductase [Alphaproteobacteria bacterium]
MIAFDSLPQAELADDGGRSLEAQLLVTADPAPAIAQAVALGYAVMPAGGLTSAIGAFAYDHELVKNFKGVLAVRPKQSPEPELAEPGTPLEKLKTNQIMIDPATATVSAGAGLTFSQVNDVLGHVVGPAARVLVDLTSIGSAMVGGVVASGSMGPLRLRPSASLVGVALAAGGAEAELLTGDDIFRAEGMQGWTGLVTAARLRYFETPLNEFGLVLPVQSGDTDALGDFLAYLHPWTKTDVPESGSSLVGVKDEATIVNGVELVTRNSLEQFILHAGDDSLKAKAQNLLQSCDYAGADWLACITGWSDHAVDDVLVMLLDEETETIGGVMIDFGVGFSSGSEMDAFRAIREGAPDLARTKARVTPPGQLKPWTTSSDVNLVCLEKDTTPLANALSSYQTYREAVDALGLTYEGRLKTEMTVYGHLNPHGLDPHHRVILTGAPEFKDDLAAAAKQVGELKKALMRDLVRVANGFGAVINGGEKGAPSLVDLMRALGGEAGLPSNLQSDLARARAAIKKAPRAFSFRAPVELLQGE